ncbi:hypothetical protein ACN4EG_26180 [Alkalinema pantanalense CENA528]|uniref:hypothetical protein n=1 Tax=Alkalinema pantanalense TaxID=1620705 RepID=UPI003D6DB25F
MHEESINAQKSKGLIHQPQGDVSQHIGNSQTTNTGGGDAAAGNLDKSTNNSTNNFFLTIQISPRIESQPSYQELSQILEQVNDLDLIRQTYRESLPMDALLSRPEASGLSILILCVSDLQNPYGIVDLE